MLERPTRRELLGYTLAVAGVAAMAPAGTGFAAPLKPTPAQPLGPFYPFRKPSEQDNDLTRVVGTSSTAHGRFLHLSGRVLTPEGEAVDGAVVEIWHTNGYGRYHNAEDRRDVPLDPGFQGFGRAETEGGGGYAFHTILPQPYPAVVWTRPAHIHFLVTAPGHKRMVTQMYFAGDSHLDGDHLLNGVSDPNERRRLIVAPTPAPEEKEDLATFDIILAPTG